MRIVELDTPNEFFTPDTLRHLHNRVKFLTGQVSDRPRHLRTPDDTSPSPSPRRHLCTTHPQRSNLAHGRRSPLLKSAQFSFAFVPLAAGLDPSRPVPAPGRPTHPHNPVLISPLIAHRPHTFTSYRPRDTTACIKNSPSPLRTPCNSSPDL